MSAAPVKTRNSENMIEVLCNLPGAWIWVRSNSEAESVQAWSAQTEQDSQNGKDAGEVGVNHE
jgi:hypothetical protein